MLLATTLADCSPFPTAKNATTAIDVSIWNHLIIQYFTNYFS